VIDIKFSSTKIETEEYDDPARKIQRSPIKTPCLPYDKERYYNLLYKV
jgi:hypothetical protein